MKKSLKKLLAVLTAMVMVLALAACGGGSEGGGGEEAAADAEPNAGVAGIVFVAPDGWTVQEASKGSYLTFKGDSGYVIGVSTYDEEDLENSREWGDNEGIEDMQQYFEKSNSDSEEDLEKANVERSAMTICDTDAYYYKNNSDNGVVGLNANFLYDNVSYSFFCTNNDNYDEEWNIKSDAAAMSDEDAAAFDAVLASVKAGDGDALMSGLMSADSIGSVSFETPEGYSLQIVTDNYVSFTKDGSEITLNASITTEEDLKTMYAESDDAPASLAEDFENQKAGLEDSDIITIAGYDGYKMIYPFEDDVYYNVSAGFLADDGLYNIYMDSNAWDMDGNIKEGAESLTEDDIAVFEAFLASMKAK